MSCRKIASRPPPPPAASALKLRVFAEDAAAASKNPPGGPSLDWTLREAVEQFVAPNYLRAKNRQPGTAKLYFQVARLWEECFSDNPTLQQIEAEPELLVQFVEWLKTRKGLLSDTLSTNTVRKICCHFQKILDLMGPRTRYSRNAAGLFVETPYLERPAAVRKPPDGDFTLSEIGQWLGACRYARRSRNIGRQNPERFHVCLILFFYNTSLRIDTVMSAGWSMIGRKPDRPHWITIPPHIYKGRTVGGDFYLNPSALAAIEAVRVPGDDRLFPWAGWPKSQSWLQEQRRRIMAHTEIPPHRRFGFHGLRKSCITWLASRNPMISKIVGGHRGGVTQDYYVNPRIVEELLDQLPQPRSIAPERQRELFE